MKREWEFFSNARSGNLGPQTRQEIQQLLTTLEGKRVRVAISVVRAQRSINQNRYYWGVVVRAAREGLADAWGLGSWQEVDAEMAHDLLKQQFNSRDLVNENTGEVLRVAGSTTALNKLEFEDYLENSRRWIQEWFNITVPLPNEQLTIDIDGTS
jgi:hypothetical protein